MTNLRRLITGLSVLASLAVSPHVFAKDLGSQIELLSHKVEAKVIENRRFLHQHPELSNQEVKTAEFIAAKLRELGLDVTTGVAKTGVIAVLKGGRAGPVVALRADMDALPVEEMVDVPFRSNVKTMLNGHEVGVMHACGHDAHMAMLLGVAEVLSSLRNDIPGTVKFIFQPAEEGSPPGELGGAKLMVQEGVLSEPPKPGAIFGLHVMTSYEVGQLAWRSGGFGASADDFTVRVAGKQTHGAYPWYGVDPIVVASQIILGLQTIASRQIDISKSPVVVSVGTIQGGAKSNIIPGEVTLTGTVRTLDHGVREDLKDRVKRTVENIAESAGASAEIEFGQEMSYPVTYNDPALTSKMLPTLRLVAGGGLVQAEYQMGSEDFAFFAQEIPGMYMLIGVRPSGTPSGSVAPNHSPNFMIDESGMLLGIRAMANLAIDWLTLNASH